MFEISVEREFCAAHAIIIRGVREATHGHNFKLTVSVAGESLDADGLLLDFHALEKAVDEVIRPFVNADLNATPPFSGQDGVNPTAEEVARHIGERVRSRLPGLSSGLGSPARLAGVRLTEAPGCAVIYRP